MNCCACTLVHGAHAVAFDMRWASNVMCCRIPGAATGLRLSNLLLGVRHGKMHWCMHLSPVTAQESCEGCQDSLWSVPVARSRGLAFSRGCDKALWAFSFSIPSDGEEVTQTACK